MNAREKAQRLMLVTNIRFRLDRDGNIVESDEPIPAAVIREAMEMPEQEYQERLENQRRQNIVESLKLDYGMQAAFSAYAQAGGALNLDEFIRLSVDIVEDLKMV